MSLDRTLRNIERAAKFGDATSDRDVRFYGRGLVSRDAIGWFGLSGNSIASSIREWLTAHGWGTGAIIVSDPDGDNLVSIAITTNVDCSQNLNGIGYQLFQTVAGSTTGWGLGLVNIFASTEFIQSTELQQCAVVQQQQQGGGSGSTVSTYTVVSGDTLSRIAARFGLTLAQLLALNPQITNPNLIHVGQIINIVRGSNTQPTTNTNPVTQPATVPANNNTPLPPKITGNGQNWFDKTFFTGAGALSGAAIGILVVLGTVVFIKTTRG